MSQRLIEVGARGYLSPRLPEPEAFASCFNTLLSLRPIGALEAIHIDGLCSGEHAWPGAARTLGLAFLHKLACLNSPPRAIPAGRRRPQAPCSREHVALREADSASGPVQTPVLCFSARGYLSPRLYLSLRLIEPEAI